ncbi:hypothetical protein O6P43_004386 [Quillaja saponaria]|uniref:Uncharacterized protein n=1 Tax=Quillaja saponaria TaxID=32244 RepID=A0AAD7Q3Q7_QUISA|nr:hypothetical protein O6P43_004386 [Quillaja saponaria]
MGRSFISLTTLLSIMVMMIIIYNIGHCKAAAAAAVAADAHSVKSTTTTTTTSSNGNTKMNMTFTTSGSAAGSGCFGFENECLKIAEVETEDTSSSADELLMESHWGRMLIDYNKFVTNSYKQGRSIRHLVVCNIPSTVPALMLDQTGFN